MERVEMRLARIEDRIEHAIAAAATAAAPSQPQNPSFSTTMMPSSTPDQLLTDIDYMTPDDISRLFNDAYSNISESTGLAVSEATSLHTKGVDSPATNQHPRLPPLKEIQPVIEHYFAHINSLVPLFSRASFIQLLHDYYTSRCPHPRVAWAAVNVVLALGSRLPVSPSADLDLGFGDSQVAMYVHNAQSVISELVAGDENLLSLQVVLGLVIIFNGLKDSRPAVVLIGTAVRLAHRLRLHSRDHQRNLSSDEALQRSRVFWIAYLFDKDICLRHHTPSVQVDDEIDLDLPAERPPDEAGNIYAKDGRVLTNFFRLRLRLAHIQGRVYNLLFSIRAAKVTPQERQVRVALLHNQLEHWRLTVPPELQADAATEHASRIALSWLCMMHFSYLGCLVMIHGMWSHDAEWRKRLIATPSSSSINGAGEGARLAPSLPKGWRYCVRMSRHCMKLMYLMPLSDCSLW